MMKRTVDSTGKPIRIANEDVLLPGGIKADAGSWHTVGADPRDDFSVVS